MAEDILKYIKERLAEYDWDDVSVGSGVPVSTISKIHYGNTPNPTIRNCQKLYDYFKDQDASD